MDYFGARYNSGAQGRFTSADLPLAAQSPSDPLSWNLYSYTANNPLNRIDPDGRNWFNINGTWEWHEGDTYDPDGPKGRRKPIKSNYTHLLVFQKTGTNEYGAVTGKLTLYEQNKAVATSTGFTAGAPDKPAVPEGTFTIRLDIRDTADVSDLQQLSPGVFKLKPSYGLQEIPPPSAAFPFDAQLEWGSLRARLNEPRGETRDEFRGQYLHGKRRAGDYTQGCICERSEQVLRLLQQLDLKQTPKVPVWVRRP